MKNITIRQYITFFVGIILMIIITSSTPMSNGEPDCITSQAQTVVKWKDMYWLPCSFSWNGFCFWPIRHKHSSFKVTITEGVPVRDDKGKVIPIANGKIEKWTVYDSAYWNEIENHPVEKNRYQDYEPIEDNEYVVFVETRYRLFHDVESTLRICTQKP